MNEIAPITKKALSKITFKVDDVKTAQDDLVYTSARAFLEGNLEEDSQNSLIAFSHSNNFKIVDVVGNHPLVTSVHLAFSEHHHLLISPDIVWITIAQGFAQHINNNAETLRHKFVDHQNKKTLTVNALMPASVEEWQSIVSQWGLQIREKIDPKLYQLMLCDFSTSTEISHTASQIVMMNAFKQYFDYRLVGICGIPSITLSGTVKDWKVIRDRVLEISQYDLQWWTDRLLPICEEFIATAEGNPNLKFWQHIYKPEGAYGGDVITGWLADLFPYLKDYITHEPIKKNHILSIPRHEITVNDGIGLQSFPIGLSETTFTIKENNKERELELLGGFIGVNQDKNKCLYPEIGWAIREKDKFSQMISSLASKYQSKSSPDWSLLRYPTEIPKELIQLSEKLSGTTLYPNTEHSWYLKIPQEYNLFELVEYNKYFTSFITLKDNRHIAYSFIPRSIGEWHEPDYKTWQEIWVVVGRVKIETDGRRLFTKGRVVLIPESTKSIAIGIPQLLERIVAAKGKYYFDDPSFVPDNSLTVLGN